eukprot:CAMPEP_0180642708 /NCGR_PEP_ID=MMETSP1037_2-20121125/47366_1 /TAXON_ID=632150 /ORGANISM="Azadinium spinosum, Strain 3D9" /LENGTH=100 /DNA_ID=CAMNT_0022666049 /DNA_START=503 /DNA_END=801 /DNA_ORIENTATION=-
MAMPLLAVVVIARSALRSSVGAAILCEEWLGEIKHAGSGAYKGSRRSFASLQPGLQGAGNQRKSSERLGSLAVASTSAATTFARGAILFDEVLCAIEHVG